MKKLFLLSLVLVSCGHDHKTPRIFPVDPVKQSPNGPVKPTPIEPVQQSYDGCQSRDSWVASQPILLAVAQGDQAAVEKLLAHGADPNAVFVANDSLHRKLTPLICAIESQHPAIAHYLLAHGANPSLRNHCGTSPLAFAAVDNLPDVASDLLDRGADPNQPNDFGETPLLYAMDHEDTAVLKELVKNPRTDVNAGQGDKWPLRRAAHSKNAEQIVPLLIDRGADPCQLDETSIPEPVQKLIGRYGYDCF